MLCMQKACTKDAFDLLTNSIAQSESVDSVYSKMILLYDTSLSPMEARKQLHDFVAYRDQNLIEISSKILKLTMRACAQTVQDKLRIELFNSESCYTLIKCLPMTSSSLCQQQYNILFTKMRHPPSFTDFTHFLDRNREIIDIDIKDNGKIRGSRTNTLPFYMEKQKKFQKSVYQINTGRNKNMSNGPYRFQRHNAQPYKNIRQFNAQACSLCGQLNHRAAQGCYQMRNNENRVVTVEPVIAPCGNCTDNNKTLFHPEAYCPDRPELKRFRKFGQKKD